MYFYIMNMIINQCCWCNARLRDLCGLKGITRYCVTNEQTHSSSIITTLHNKKERGDVSSWPGYLEIYSLCMVTTVVYNTLSKSNNGFLCAHALISQIPTKARLCFDYVITCMWLFDVHKVEYMPFMVKPYQASIANSCCNYISYDHLVCLPSTIATQKFVLAL